MSGPVGTILQIECGSKRNEEYYWTWWPSGRRWRTTSVVGTQGRISAGLPVPSRDDLGPLRNQHVSRQGLRPIPPMPARPPAGRRQVSARLSAQASPSET